MTTASHGAARPRLPDKAQINAIASISALEDLDADLVASIHQIQVDLEFRTDDHADEGWERRTRGALSAHRICLTHVRKRIHRLSGKAAVNAELGQIKAAEKAARRAQTLAQQQLASQRSQAVAEAAKAHAKAQQAQAAEKRRQQVLERVENLSWLRCFKEAARDRLDAETYGALLERAGELQGEATRRELLAQLGEQHPVIGPGRQVEGV